MNIYTELKRMVKMPTPLEIASSQLIEAELELLKAETGVEYASSMVMFNKAQIKRLKSYVAVKELGFTE